MGNDYRDRINTAKRKIRSDLKLRNWAASGFAGKRADEFDELMRAPDSLGGVIRRIDAREYSNERFFKELDSQGVPCVVGGLVEKDGWGVTGWELEVICNEFRNVQMKCGEDDKGNAVKMTLKDFKRYNSENKDDSPLYIFDSKFDEREETKSICARYRVPSYFRQDYFSCIPRDRPPYKWFLLGPKRSGTTVHVDPNQSSAWNMLLSGYKRWVIFDGHHSKRTVRGKDFMKKDEDDEASNYFVDVLPRIKAARNPPKIYEFTQRPGEMVFLPNGWWHGVLNLTDTVAVTQNFVTAANFDKAWEDTRTGRPCMARRWLAALKTEHPDMFARANEINRRDGFDMMVEQQKRHARREKKEAKKIDAKLKKTIKRMRSPPSAGEREMMRERIKRKRVRARSHSSSSTSSTSSSSSSSSSRS
eukprot:TRINITY_DN33668_c0_g1_i1.p1 TRINITY_DN33668_c0_g1~~TRINITY_DN33668_c0_g1_i1.p1  ORF type:complete len:418 (+),score=57.44 TRINITY_DN33668_c0_g1_i1:57-1310(+)